MLRSLSTVTLCNAALQGFGVLRMIIIAAALGLTRDVDHYYLALALSSLVIVVAGNWVQFSFLGRYTALLSEGSTDQAHSFRSSVFVVLLLLIVPVVAIFWLFPDTLMSWFAGAQYVPGQALALGYISLVILPAVMADYMGQCLNGHQRFTLAAVAPLANAVVATVSLWWWPDKDLIALVGSLLLGGITQWLIILPGYLSLGGGLRWAPEIKAELASVARITLWVVPAMLLSNAMLSVMQFSVARLGDGAVSMMGYASRMNSSLAQLLIIGLGTILIPVFASLVAQHDYAQIQAIYKKLMRGIGVACITICVGVYLLGADLLGLLLVRGAFTNADAQAVTQLLLILSFSLLPLAMGSFVARYFNAVRRADLIFASSVIGFVGTSVVALLGVQLGSVYWVACAPLVCYSMTSAYWLRQLAKEVAVRAIIGDLCSSIGRGVVVVLPIVAVDYLLVQWMTGDIVLVAIRVVTFAALFVFIGYITRLHSWIND